MTPAPWETAPWVAMYLGADQWVGDVPARYVVLSRRVLCYGPDEATVHAQAEREAAPDGGNYGLSWVRRHGEAIDHG